MEKFKGVLALICVAMKCNVLTWFFFFFLFLFQVCLFLCLFSHGFKTHWTKFPSLELFSGTAVTEARYCFVFHPEHPPAPGRGEGEKKGGAGAEVLFTRALTLSRGVTGLSNRIRHPNKKKVTLDISTGNTNANRADPRAIFHTHRHACTVLDGLYGKLVSRNE